MTKSIFFICSFSRKWRPADAFVVCMSWIWKLSVNLVYKCSFISKFSVPLTEVSPILTTGCLEKVLQPHIGLLTRIKSQSVLLDWCWFAEKCLVCVHIKGTGIIMFNYDSLCGKCSQYNEDGFLEHEEIVRLFPHTHTKGDVVKWQTVELWYTLLRKCMFVWASLTLEGHRRH